MLLTEEQRSDLFIKLHKKFREVGDIDGSLREIENKEDFLNVFSRYYVKDGDKILGSYESLKVKQVQAVLNRAKELDISFVEIINLPVFLLSLDSENKEQKGISLFRCIKDPDFKFLSEVLKVIDETYGLKPLWRDISAEDRKKIKTQLNKDEHKGVLDKINQIEEMENQEVQTDNTADDNLSETDSNVTVIGDSVHTTEKISSTAENLYLDLQNAIDKKEDIAEILKSATKEDLLSTFAEREEQEENANLLYNILQKAKHRLAFFREVKEKGILQDLLNANLSVMKTRQLVDVDNETKTPNIDTEYKLVEYIIDPKASNLLVLDEIKEVFGFKEFWEASSEADRNIIKGALERERQEDDQEKSKYEGFLEEIKEIEKKIESEKDQSKVKKVNTANTGINYSLVGSEGTRKAFIAFGCSVAIGLVVGLGSFAAGTSLGGAAIIGVMAGAGVFFGLAFGALAITLCMAYKASSPNNELNDVNAQPTVSKASEVEA